MIPRFLQAKKFYPTDSEGMGRKLLEIYTASKMNGMGLALEIWKGLSDGLAEKMKKEIVNDKWFCKQAQALYQYLGRV